MNSKLTHLDADGQANMVDVGNKAETLRFAIAEAFVQMQPQTLALIIEGGHKKGDVLTVARIAGIQAAKRTWELIPLCHPVILTSVKVKITPVSDNCLRVEVNCKNSGQTGVEMEALTAASVAALTIYDMCKAVDRGISVDKVRLLQKAGGKSGDWIRENEQTND